MRQYWQTTCTYANGHWSCARTKGACCIDDPSRLFEASVTVFAPKSIFLGPPRVRHGAASGTSSGGSSRVCLATAETDSGCKQGPCIVQPECGLQHHHPTTEFSPILSDRSASCTIGLQGERTDYHVHLLQAGLRPHPFTKPPPRTVSLAGQYSLFWPRTNLHGMKTVVPLGNLSVHKRTADPVSGRLAGVIVS